MGSKAATKVDATLSDLHDNGKEQKLQKKLKKQQKKGKQSKTVPEETASKVMQDAEADESVKQKKKVKKDKKEKRKEFDPAAQAEGPEDGVGNKRKAVPSPDEPAAGTKKVKKAKKAASKAASGASAYAAVGDPELAKLSLPIIKDLYTEHASTTEMTAVEVAAFRDKRQIVVEGADLKPMTSFDQLGFEGPLLHALSGFKAPSPIQAQCWPIILKGHDMIGIAATGSGKTLGFGMPALRHIQEQRSKGVVTGKGPFMLCMAPTRELAQQICDVLQDAGSKCGVGAVCIYGGVPKGIQAKVLRSGVEIAVGTPGRVADLLQDGTLNVQEVTYLVLDEADRMLDMGFEPEIRKIVGPVRADRQTLMFSATWPMEIQKLAMEFLVSPVKITIGSQELAASHSVAQTVEVIDEFARNDRLVDLLKKYHKSRSNRIIIFVLYKKEAPRVEQLLQRKGFKASAIHGDISQEARNRAVELFKSAEIPLLIATDVAARGLDIPDVEVVINYSFPLTVEDYVHRIGRTGRAGKSGISHTFFVGKNDKPKAGELVNVLREAGQTVPKELLSFGTAVKKKESKLYGAHFKEVDMTVKAKKVTFDSDSD